MRKEKKVKQERQQTCGQSLWAATCFPVNRSVSGSFSLHVHNIAIYCSDTGVCSASRSIMLNQPSPNNFTCDCSLQWVVGLVQGLWLLLPCQFGALTETRRYLAVALSHVGSCSYGCTGLALSRAPAVPRWGDVGVGNLKPYQDTPNKRKHLSGHGGIHF